MGYQSVNPYDGKIVKTFEVMSDNELETAIFAANKCFESWRSTTFAQRATIVSRAAAILRERADEFARLATFEMGKLIDEARGEVLLSADILHTGDAAVHIVLSQLQRLADFPHQQVRNEIPLGTQQIEAYAHPSAAFVQVDPHPGFVLIGGELHRAFRCLEIDHRYPPKLAAVDRGRVTFTVARVAPLAFNQVKRVTIVTKRFGHSRSQLT